jgi:Tol biopolymer transport system component
MNREGSLDQRISTWLLEEAPDQLPDRVLLATFERTRTSRQRRVFPGLIRLPRLMPARWVFVAIALLALLVAGLLVVASRPSRPEPLGIGRNGLIAYDKDWHIFTQAADVNQSGAVQSRKRLTTGSNDFWPEWSPDGSKLAFYRSADQEFWQGVSVWVINADGSQPINLTGDMTIGIEEAWQLAWAPDSDRLAFAANIGGSPLVYVARADGSELRQITEPRLLGTAPAWSPDGRTLAINVGDLDRQSGIYLVNPDGSGLRQLTTQRHTFNGYSVAVWSPDGKHLLFHAGSPGSQDIWIVDVDGSNERALMTTAYPIDEIGPAWSPDGSRVAYLRLDHGEGTGTVVAMDGDGGHMHTISPPTADGPVEWSPDGTRVMARLCPTVHPSCEGEDIWNIVALDPAAVAQPESINSDRGIGLLSWQRLPP